MTAKELNDWMAQNYWTPKMLAKRLGITPTTLSRYRTGKRSIPQAITEQLKGLER